MTKQDFRKVISFNLRSVHPLKNRTLVYAGLFLLVFVSLTTILSWRYFPAPIYKEGVVASRDILAPRTFDVVNEEATQEAQIEAINSVAPVYKADVFLISRMESDLKTEFSIFKQLRSTETLNDPLKSKELKSQLPVKISDQSLKAFIEADENSFDQMKIFTWSLITEAMQNVIKPDDPEAIKKARQEVRSSAESIKLPHAQQTAVSELASEALRPNATVDWEETSRRRQERKNSVQPVLTTIKKGQVIVGKGQIITPEHIKILEALGVQRSNVNLPGLAGIAILVLVSLFMMENYISRAMPELAKNPSHLLLLIIIVIPIVLLSSLLVEINPYWAPIPIASLLIAILINSRLAVIITAFLSIVTGILTGEVQYSVAALLTGIAAVFTAGNVHRRFELVMSAVIIFFVNELSVVVFSLIQGETMNVFLENLVYGGINGFSSGIVAIGLLPLLEHAFGITTGMRFLELTNQSEPLLKRLLMEAHGTYHHSILVGNLAEAGAVAVGEDPLLCRAASYYHDIGKLQCPYFFIENQLGSENPHDKISPNLSALIIIKHVKDGLELGRKYKLPAPILDVISQHHGTGLTSYFYQRAKESGDKDALSEAGFRYPGPRPNTKAAAIVMMADACEAAARTLQSHTPQSIENLVQSIFKRALEDGQLDESPLSLKNINDLITTFTRIITGIYHHRIEYPDQITEQDNNSKVAPIKVKA